MRQNRPILNCNNNINSTISPAANVNAAATAAKNWKKAHIDRFAANIAAAEYPSAAAKQSPLECIIGLAAGL